MKLRPYTNDDFETISTWWQVHHGGDFSPLCISRSAFVVEDDGIPTGYFSMHPMDCGFCYLGFPMVDPKAEKEKRALTIDMVIESAKLWAKHADFPIVFISTRGESFLNRLRTKGFIADDGNNTHMFYKVEM